MAALRAVLPRSPSSAVGSNEQQTESNEGTPLLPRGAGQDGTATASVVVYTDEPAEQQQQKYGQQQQEDMAADSTPTADEAEDEDLDGPENTSRMAIVVEAAVLVSCAVFLAAVAPGISFVLEIIGTVFGITLMLILPGLAGMFLFGPEAARREEQQQNNGTQSYQYFAAADRNRTVLTSGLSPGRRQGLRIAATVITVIGLSCLAVGLVSLGWR